MVAAGPRYGARYPPLWAEFERQGDRLNCVPNWAFCALGIGANIVGLAAGQVSLGVGSPLQFPPLAGLAAVRPGQAEDLQEVAEMRDRVVGHAI